MLEIAYILLGMSDYSDAKALKEQRALFDLLLPLQGELTVKVAIHPEAILFKSCCGTSVHRLYQVEESFIYPRHVCDICVVCKHMIAIV